MISRVRTRRRLSDRALLYSGSALAVLSLLFASGGGGNWQFWARHLARIAATQPGPIYADPEDPTVGTYTIAGPEPWLFVVRMPGVGTVLVVDRVVRRFIAGVGLAIAAVCLAPPWATRALAQGRSSRGRCPVYGYDCRATPGRCPECGTDAVAGPPHNQPLQRTGDVSAYTD